MTVCVKNILITAIAISGLTCENFLNQDLVFQAKYFYIAWFIYQNEQDDEVELYKNILCQAIPSENISLVENIEQIEREIEREKDVLDALALVQKEQIVTVENIVKNILVKVATVAITIANESIEIFKQAEEDGDENLLLLASIQTEKAVEVAEEIVKTRAEKEEVRKINKKLIAMQEAIIAKGII